jgi:uncharacterized membrane protein YeaQ/YmgE (transglycosylase-associated protein family)
MKGAPACDGCNATNLPDFILQCNKYLRRINAVLTRGTFGVILVFVALQQGPAAGRGSLGYGEDIMTLEGLIIWLIIGAIAGWLAGLLVKGGGFGLIGDIIVGIVGALIGGWLAGVLGIGIGSGFIASIITAIAGAVILLVILRAIKRA